MKKIIRNNTPLFLGISLPILLILIFLVTQSLPKYFINPPNEKLLFTAEYFEYQNDQFNNYEINIENGKINFFYRKLKFTRQKPRFFIFNTAKRKITEVNYVLPIVSDTKWHEVKIPKLSEITLNTNKTSPDGFVFHKINSDNLNLLEIIFNNKNHSNYVISKKGYVIPIKSKKYNNLNEIQFLGWINNDN